MRILVLGSSGLLGANFVMSALDRGHIVYPHCFSHAVYFPGLDPIILDLTSSLNIDNMISDIKPDWIVNCVAATDVDKCEIDKSWAQTLNDDIVFDLSSICSEYGVKLVHISTDMVFDGIDGGYNELDRPNPINTYGLTKLSGEMGAHENLLELIIARTTIYGWNVQNKKSLAEWGLSEIRAGRSITGYDNILFSPILVNDLSHVLLTMMNKRLYGLYHIGGGEAISKYSFLVKMAEIFGEDVKLVKRGKYKYYPPKAQRPENLILNSILAWRGIGEAPPSVEEGLLRFKRLEDIEYLEKVLIK